MRLRIRQTKKKIVSREARRRRKVSENNKEIHTSEKETIGIDVQDEEDRRPEKEKLPEKGPGKQII